MYDSVCTQMMKSLLILFYHWPIRDSVQCGPTETNSDGTYYCDVTVSLPGVNPCFVPEEYMKITLFVTGMLALRTYSDGIQLAGLLNTNFSTEARNYSILWGGGLV